MLRYKQHGFNIAFPREIEVWRLGETLPEWISDVCKVKFENNFLVPEINRKVSGGYEILESGILGNVFISTNSEKDYIAKDIYGHKIVVLSETMLDILYDPISLDSL